MGKKDSRIDFLEENQSFVESSNAKIVEEHKEESIPVVATRRIKSEPRKGFTFTLRLTEYNNFIKYLDDNDIRYGSELIRNLLKEKGII